MQSASLRACHLVPWPLGPCKLRAAVGPAESGNHALSSSRAKCTVIWQVLLVAGLEKEAGATQTSSKRLHFLRFRRSLTTNHIIAHTNTISSTSSASQHQSSYHITISTFSRHSPYHKQRHHQHQSTCVPPSSSVPLRSSPSPLPKSLVVSLVSATRGGRCEPEMRSRSAVVAVAMAVDDLD